MIHTCNNDVTNDKHLMMCQPHAGKQIFPVKFLNSSLACRYGMMYFDIDGGPARLMIQFDLTYMYPQSFFAKIQILAKDIYHS